MGGAGAARLEKRGNGVLSRERGPIAGCVEAVTHGKGGGWEKWDWDLHGRIARWESGRIGCALWFACSRAAGKR